MSALPIFPVGNGETVGPARLRGRSSTRSHIILRQGEPPHRRLVVPDHDEIAKRTLRALLRDAGLTVEQLRRML